jgi:chromosome segregation ATPase
MIRASATVAVMVGIGMLAGCKSDPGRERSKATIASMHDVRQQLQVGVSDVDAVQATLNAFQNNSRDQRALYAQYKDQVEQVEDRAEDISAEVAAMQQRVDTYRSAWRQEAAQIADPDLRQAAQERAEVIQERLNTIIADYRATKDAYYPFIRKLRDVETFLSNDLTAGGVNAAKPSMQEAVRLGDTLKEQARQVIQGIDEALPRLSPATAPAERATTRPASGS